MNVEYVGQAGFVLAAIMGAAGAIGAPMLEVDGDFAGGNVIVERIEGDAVFLRHDLRDTQGNWFYWCFRVRGAEGRTLRFEFTGGDVMGTMGPACSTDGGRTWTWLGQDVVEFASRGPAGTAVEAASFQYAFTDDREVRFCFSIPYVEANLKQFLARHAQSPALKTATLCKSVRGRDIEVLYAGHLEGTPRYRLALVARHHACESVASFVLEGFLDAALGDDDLGQWYRRHVAIMAVPFMDKDGVEEGDQGKNRRPHDHNRDYPDPSIYPSVATIKTQLPRWSEEKLDIAIDLHSPWRLDTAIHFAGGRDPQEWERTTRFCKILEASCRGQLPYREQDNIPFGTAWNTGEGPLRTFRHWASGLPNIHFAATLEIPYAQAHGQTVSEDTARAFGRDLAAALRQYLVEQIPRERMEATAVP